MNTETNANASSGNGIPTQLVIDLTQTDLPLGTPVYVYILGLVTDQFYYINSDGAPTIMKLSDNTIPAQTFPGMKTLSTDAQNAIIPGYPLEWADYSMKVEVGSNLILDLGSINTNNIPGLGTGTAAFSGRVYFSVGVPKLPFTVQQSGYTAPVYGNGSGVTGSLCLYDWIEFSYDSEGNFNGNTTQVNQFGFPLILTGTNIQKQTFPSQGLLNTSVVTILNNIANAAAPFGGSGAVVPIPDAAAAAYPENLGYLRAISPVTISGSGTSMNTYFDADLTTAYAAWQATPLVTNDPSTGYYSGVVFPVSGNVITAPDGYPAGSLAFYQGNFPTLASLVAALVASPSLEPTFYLTGSENTVTSNDIWQCAGSLATGSTAQENVGKMFAAAFNRGVMVSTAQPPVVLTSLDDNTCSGLASSFYPSGGTYNEWASWFHKYNSNGLAYGFPYDDVCGQNPSIPPSGDTLVASFIRIALGNFYS